MKREALHIEGPTIGYAMMTELSKKISIATPFITWPIMIISGAVLRGFWPGNLWVLGAIGMMTAFFSVFVWYLTHDRKGLASEHAAFTTIAYGLTLAMVDYVGWTKVTWFMMLFGVGFICATWSVRNAIRHHDASQGGNISKLFDDVGMEGTKMHVKPRSGELRKRWSLPWRQSAAEGDSEEADPTGKQRRNPVARRREAKIILKPGETVDGLTKKLGNLESAAGVPPGTFVVTADMDNASRADAVISDPRAIKKPVPYPGPSYVGGSIADTISPGLYQDGTENEWHLPGLQLQVMGMTGSGKSLGVGWSVLAEIITRYDAVVWGVDLNKGDQTLGPLRNALHRIETTPEGAYQLFMDVWSLIKPRTNYLQDKGLGKWRKGCGLQYLVVWLEEVPEIIEALEDLFKDSKLSGEELFVKIVRAARSAGITFAWSLQRSDNTQIPTIARGQAAKICCGVSDSHEAHFGLSSVQNNADCSPEHWGNRRPGMYYIDAPSIDDKHIPMPARAWYWGEDDKAIRAHADKYPASERPYDEVMVAVLSGDSSTSTAPIKRAPVKVLDESEVESEVEGVLKDSDLDEELADLENDYTFEKEKVDPLPPAVARKLVRDWLVNRAGQTVTNSDLIEVRKKTGYGRSWGYKIMREFSASGLVRRIDSPDGVSWAVTDRESILSQDD